MFDILVIAFSLSLDAFSLAVSFGLSHTNSSLRSKLRLSLSFGFFQFIMPILGFWLGGSISHFVDRFDHFFVFTILALVGGKMLFDGFKGREEDKKTDISQGIPLLLASIATSLDAFAVGISFAILKKELLLSSVIIGITTLIMSYGGVHFGNKIGKKWVKRPELIGGLAILVIAFKTLLQGL